ncbi:MAG: NAD(+)/NADH kinase, partial [Candidatus Aenigmatarchaeota archaeon]
AKLNGLEDQITIEHAIVGRSVSLFSDAGDASVLPGSAVPECDVLVLDCEGAELDILEKDMLSVEIAGEKFGDALNEGVIRSDEPSRVLFLKVLVDGEEVEEIKGDGVIVAAPTGSTAYALSAGGPVIDPRIEAFTVVPLSTHRPRSMPLVVPMSSEVEIELLKPGREADVTIDGQIIERVEGGSTVRFSHSDIKAKFFDWGKDFFGKMREKL